MDFKEIQELIKLIQKSNLTEFKLKEGEFELTLRTDKYRGDKGHHFTPPASQPYPQVTSVPPLVPPAITPQQTAAPGAENQGEPVAPPAAGPGAQMENTSGYLSIRSPMVGTFYRSPAPDKGPYVKVGDIIEKGAVVCIIEAMKLFNEIDSEHSGRIVKVLVEDAQPVEYDQVLFLVDPKG